MWYVVFRSIWGLKVSRPHLTCLAATEHEEFLLTLTSIIATQTVSGPPNAALSDLRHNLREH